jgi:hypothetical protein
MQSLARNIMNKCTLAKSWLQARRRRDHRKDQNGPCRSKIEPYRRSFAQHGRLTSRVLLQKLRAAVVGSHW